MTGLIYLVIIALWAAVLIPIWLRRHDQISEVRSTARFSSAMRTLAGSGAPQLATEPAYSLEPAPRPRPVSRPSRPEVRVRPTSDRPAEGLDPTYERELARQAAATRRAVVLGLLTLALLVALLLAVAGMLPRWAPIAAAVPVIAFVTAAALTAKQRSGRADRARIAPGPRAARPVPAAAAATVPVIEDDWETWNAWDDEDAWDAVPTTLPTYVSAPRASAMPRRIERDGDWGGEAMVETARSLRHRPKAEPLAPIDHAADTAELPSVRRAVNE